VYLGGAGVWATVAGCEKTYGWLCIFLFFKIFLQNFQDNCFSPSLRVSFHNLLGVVFRHIGAYAPFILKACYTYFKIETKN
jgi:hypothetical protein